MKISALARMITIKKALLFLNGAIGCWLFISFLGSLWFFQESGGYNGLLTRVCKLIAFSFFYSAVVAIIVKEFNRLYSIVLSILFISLGTLIGVATLGEGSLEAFAIWIGVSWGYFLASYSGNYTGYRIYNSCKNMGVRSNSKTE
jgi:hypothetical protein